MTEQSAILCVCIFSIHLTVNGHLGCFRLLATVNNVAMNTELHLTFGIKSFLQIYAQEWNCYIIWPEEPGGQQSMGSQTSQTWLKRLNNNNKRTHGQTPKRLLSRQLPCVYVDCLFSMRIVLSSGICRYPREQGFILLQGPHAWYLEGVQYRIMWNRWINVLVYTGMYAWTITIIVKAITIYWVHAKSLTLC